MLKYSQSIVLSLYNLAFFETIRKILNKNRKISFYISLIRSSSALDQNIQLNGSIEMVDKIVNDVERNESTH